MKVYKKPSVVGEIEKVSAIPFGAAAAKAFASGVALGLARGKTSIDSNHTQIINAHHKK